MSSKQDSCWTEKWKEKYRRLMADGDSDGLRRLVFGRYVCEARGEKTQSEAAKLAKMERADWNRIENSHLLPPSSRIPDIAAALSIENPATLFRKAGYAVPKEFATYDREEARRKFRKALRESSTLAQFLINMYEVWQIYLLELRDDDTARPRGKRLKLSHDEIFSPVEKHLTVAQKLHLARELINLSVGEVKVKRMNLRELYNDIDTALAKLELSKKLG